MSNFFGKTFVFRVS